MSECKAKPYQETLDIVDEILDGNGPITRRFWKFHRENPGVYVELVNMAHRLRGRGYGSYGMKSLFEVLRWERAIKTVGSVFKLNNNYTSLYARLIMSDVPMLGSFFKVRQPPNIQVVE